MQVSVRLQILEDLVNGPGGASVMEAPKRTGSRKVPVSTDHRSDPSQCVTASEGVFISCLSDRFTQNRNLLQAVAVARTKATTNLHVMCLCRCSRDGHPTENESSHREA